MINLLPPDLKQNYRYARYNRKLVRWSCALLLAIIGMGIITAGGLAVMNRSISTHNADIAKTKTSLEEQNISVVQKQVSDMSNNLKLMVTVLSKEILFTKLLGRLGAITPPDVVLTNLSISQTESAIDVTARAKSYSAASQLQANLADPGNKVFSKADVVAITCATNNTQTTLTDYPCTVSIKALFASDNPFLFINASTGKVGS